MIPRLGELRLESLWALGRRNMRDGGLSRFCRAICVVSVLLTHPGCVKWHRHSEVPAAIDPDAEQWWPTEDSAEEEREDSIVPAALQREEPAVESQTLKRELATQAPLTLDAPSEYHELSLAEVLEYGLQHSEVIADVGGAMLRSSSNATTVFDPAIQETSPRSGLITALSEFDTNFTARLFAENNDRQLNNTFLGGGTRSLKQDTAVAEWGFTKRSATGAEFWLGTTLDYDSNNAPGNQFVHAYNAIIGAEIRQPLLRGAGSDFNRIAGPRSLPGNYNGVLVSRLDTDISLAKFESGVRDYVSRVEDAYWELYFAYRNLDAKVRERDTALEAWRRIQVNAKVGRRGSEPIFETQARDQVQRLQAEVQNALIGRLVEGTQTSSGTLGSAFRGSSGVHVADRRLRLLIGLPINDGALIRPSDEPTLAPIEYDWQETLLDALTRRVELRQQKALVQRRELEYEASKNYLKPRVDLVMQHRVRGFGRNLLDESATGSRSGAFNQLANFDHQESQFGIDVEVPIGNRRGNATVQHAELQLRRERAVLRRLERQVTHDVSNAISNVSRAWAVANSASASLEAAQERVAAAQAEIEQEEATVDVLFEAQRRLAAAESEYHRAVVEYSLATKTVELKKGTLLNYNGITLAEAGWQADAIAQVEERNRLRGSLEPEGLIKRGRVISRGYLKDELPTASTKSQVLLPPPTAPPSASYEPPDLLPPPGASTTGNSRGVKSLAPLLGDDPVLPADPDEPEPTSEPAPTAKIKRSVHLHDEDESSGNVQRVGATKAEAAPRREDFWDFVQGPDKPEQ